MDDWNISTSQNMIIHSFKKEKKTQSSNNQIFKQRHLKCVDNLYLKKWREFPGLQNE